MIKDFRICVYFFSFMIMLITEKKYLTDRDIEY